MPNTRGHKVIIRDKSLVNAINRILKGSGVEPEEAIEAMAPFVMACCEHAASARRNEGAPVAIKGAGILREIYTISLEMSEHIKPKETIKNVQ